MRWPNLHRWVHRYRWRVRVTICVCVPMLAVTYAWAALREYFSTMRDLWCDTRESWHERGTDE